MQDGIVKFYNTAKGYGFIQPERGGADGSSDVFVHATALERAGLGPLAEGDKVSFDTEVDRRNGKTCVGNIQMG
jgi:CspA family cold shock protein